MMDAELKAKWIAALRSGEFKQGKNYLRRGGAHCCLGVLCEILKDQVGGEWLPTNAMFPNVGASFAVRDDYGRTSGANDFLPYKVASSVGINHYQMEKLAELNDNPDGGLGFHEIANYIEEYL